MQIGLLNGIGQMELSCVGPNQNQTPTLGLRKLGPERGSKQGDALPSHGGETQARVSQSQVAELGLGSTLPASNSRKG